MESLAILPVHNFRAVCDSRVVLLPGEQRWALPLRVRPLSTNKRLCRNSFAGTQGIVSRALRRALCRSIPLSLSLSLATASFMVPRLTGPFGPRGDQFGQLWVPTPVNKACRWCWTLNLARRSSKGDPCSEASSDHFLITAISARQASPCASLLPVCSAVPAQGGDNLVAKVILLCI